MKKALKIFWSIVVAIAVLLFALWLLFQTPFVQTFLVRKVTDAIGKDFNGKIEFSKVHLKPFNAIVLKDVAVIDDDPPLLPSGETADTLASARSVVTTFSLRGLLRKEGVHILRASVSDASFTLVNDSTGNNIGRVFGKSGKAATEKKEMGRLFDAGKVQVENFRFRLVNLKGPVRPKDFGIDWKDLDITVHSLSAHDLSLAHGYMKGVLDALRATEKSGYEIRSLSGKTRVGHGMTLVQDIHLIDNWSDIRINEYSMSYADIKSFSKYLEEVRMTGSIEKSTVDFRSLSYFAQGLKGKDIRVALAKADVEGTVSDLGINRFEFREEGSQVSGSAEGRISGLPDIGDTSLDFDLEGLSFTSEGLEKFIKGFAPAARLDLGKFAPGERIVFDGRVKGLMDALNLNGAAHTTSMGSLTADVKAEGLITKGSTKKFSGGVSTDKLDIGSIAGISQIGEVTLHSVLEASLGGKGTSVRIDSLKIDALQALGYSYSDILAAGTYTDKAFDGRLVCNDPNLNLLFQGIFTLSDKTSNGLYKFYANVGYADLNALGLDKRGVSKVSGRINANYMRVNSSGDMIGDLDILGLSLENSSGLHDVGDICITSHNNNDVNRINLTSSFADASYVGTKPLTGIFKDIRELTVQRELPVLVKDTTRTWNGDTYQVRFDLHDSRDILSFAMPGLYIADSTIVRLSVSANGDVKATVKSPRIAMKRNYLRNLDLAFDNRDESLNGVLTGSELALGGMVLHNNNITLYADSDHLGIGCSYENPGELTDKGEIYLSGEFERDQDGKLLIHGMTLPSSIWFNDDEWTITSSSIESVGKDIEIDNLSVASNGQSIRFNGGFSTTRPDTLTVEMVRFNMALANRFLGENFGISGQATGHGRLITPWKDNAGLLLSLSCDSVQVAGREVGKLNIGSSMDETGKLHLLARNDLDGTNTFRLIGDYFTKDKTLDAVAELNGMDAGYIAPVLASVFSETGGRISGNVRIKGPTDNLSLSGEDTRFDNVMLKVAFTNVPYYADGPFSVSDNGVVFNDIALRDRYDGTGTLSGGILFDHLKDIRMDARIRMSRMEAIDMDSKSGQAFYGNVFASGNVDIKGPFNAIQLDVNARTDKNGSIHIPLDNASKNGNSNLLVFKQEKKEVYIDPYDVMMNRLVAENRKDSDFGLRLRINANQGTEAFVEIDRSAGNTLNGRGQGNLDIAVRPSRGLFTINGDYTLNSGNFHFNAIDIVSRDFTISDGSSVRFKGDVMESDLDIEGVYSTKASIATLIADTTSVSARRTVNCGIGISGKLREPQLTFSVDIPDLDPTIKSRVESALNTEDKVQRQFLALLISGGFMPEEQSGVVNNSGTLYSNLAEIMAGQLNNILQKLDIPLDFGLNYQTGASGASIFDLAVSTQLFNNRVIVNGNVGNREYSNSSDVVGDLDIEIKLDRPGQVRLKLFSHSSDDYTNFLDNTQRNGVGLTYQKEFNTFREFFRNLFTGRKRRESRSRTAPPPNIAEREVNSIRIEE